MTTPARSPADDLRAALDERLRAALRALAGGPWPAVHGPRKRIKEMRALLRLGRELFDPADLATWSSGLRDAAHALAPLRDAEVLPRSIAYLGRLIPGDDPEVRAALVALGRQARSESDDRRRLARRALSEAVYRLLRVQRSARLRAGSRGTRSRARVIASLAGTYRRGARDRRALHHRSSSHRFHEWRKQVKLLHHQLRYVAAGGLGECTVEAIDRLAGLLGDEHDFALLAERLADGWGAIGDRARRALLDAIARIQLGWRRKALRKGRRIYRGSAARFVDAVTRGSRRA